MKTKFVEIIKGIFGPFISISLSIGDKVKKSIRFELILIFAMCLLVAIIIGSTSNKLLETKHQHIKTDYSQSIEKVSNQLLNIANNINDKNISINDKLELQKILNQFKHDSGELNAKIYEHDIDSKLPSVFISFLSFLIIFYFITNKKMKYIEIVSIGLLEISKGNLDYRIKKHGKDELAILADNINYMAEELKAKIESERKAEKTKNDLITNVSHDLRTPLTSIKGYLELIKNKKYTQENQLDQYANISYNQAERLELLINDLFEYTKLANSAVVFDRQNIALNELLDQLIEELVPIFENTTVTISKEFIKEKVIVNVDPGKVARVFENLLINAIRYSIKPSDIRVILTVDNGFSLVSIKNKCEEISEDNLSKIFDRFYRVEQSRSSDTGGSGLGLAIAKSMVELQQGFIEAKYEDGYISFNVKFKIINDKS
ncbi:HAMP domain-containing histidine kinase [Clostridium estertheticum]|uniref:sensor histidine kinase n=1 Tax=Clostridium estertheticum TaxID=238834 RepID=UPI001CD169FD|nr:HAMP domain-containing sensor histidine kinase [Clostridium estertheticum]MBZ9686111.1 HAMP domain-containing histidine kinase [Clostridium estertheticum]